MTPIQERLMDLILEIDDICKRHNIPYYLSGGSVIGAIRHKGFIPWDDDIDILLDRKYWDKFYKVFQEEMPENRALGCLENNQEYLIAKCKYCDVSSTVIHKNELFGDDSAGVIIDIILMDSLPDGKEAWREYIENLLAFFDLANVYHVYGSRFDIDVPYKKYLFLSKLFGKKRVLEKLEAKLRKYESEECDYYIVRWAGGPSVFPKSMFGNPKYVEFENHMLPIPEKAGDFLRDLYGDEWVEVPMPGKQMVHDTIMDLERSYDEYFKEYVPRIGYKKATKGYISLKKKVLKSKRFQFQESKMVRGAECAKEKYLIEKRISEEKLNPLYMFENAEYDKLFELFGAYMNCQGSNDCLGSEFGAGLTKRYDPVYVDLGDKYLNLVLWLWIYQGRLSKAYKLLRARIMVQGAEMEPALDKTHQFILDMRNAISLYEQQQYGDSHKQVIDLLSRAECPVTNLWKLRIRLERILGIDDAGSELQWIEMCLIHSPEDGELIKYKTDRLYAKQGIESVYAEYVHAYEHTRNGIIWMEVESIFRKELSWALGQIQTCIDSEAYETALKIADCWGTFLIDSIQLKYLRCVCMSQMEQYQKQAEETVRELIAQYPDEKCFAELLQQMNQKNGEILDYFEFEIRILRAKQYSEYKSILDDLEKQSGRDKRKLELMSKLCGYLGEKKREIQLCRELLAEDGGSQYASEVLIRDRQQMVAALADVKKKKLRKALLDEWNWKYPDEIIEKM